MATLTLSDKTKITDATINASHNWLATNYKPFNPTHGASAYALLVAHGATPCTHADAKTIATRFLVLRGLPVDMLSNNSVWHSVKNKVARTRNSDAKKRYSADARTPFGPSTMRCTNDKHGITRSRCETVCKQGLAIDKVFVATTLKAKAPSTRKKGRSTTKKQKATETIPNEANAPTQPTSSATSETDNESEGDTE